MTAVIILLALIGIVVLFGAIFNWDLMFRSSALFGILHRLGVERARTIYAVIGFVFLAAAGVLLFVSMAKAPLPAKPDALALLSVGPDGCTVERTAITGSDEMNYLQWLVTDQQFKTVLTQNAGTGMTFHYDQSGTYDVVLQGLHEGLYVTISNKVEVNCP